MPPDPLVQDEDYASSEDSDFAPDPEGAPDRDSSASGSEDEGARDATAGGAKKQRKRKRASGDADAAEAEDAGFENSGDEAIIQKGRKRRRKAPGKDGADRGDGEDGEEGGLIKTRSQRAIEKAERKIQAVSGPVTVDVDALWAQMTSGPADTSTSPSKAQEKPGVGDQATVDSSPARASAQPVGTSLPSKGASDTIHIKRTYNFAGKVHTEEKVVARDSAEARLYLASLGENADPDAEADSSSPKRMPRRAFRSVFEPITDQLQTRSDLNLGMSVRLQARELAREAGAKKLNTVEMSRMDWAGYVDKEGIKDELELAGKSKASYAERQDFLARSEARREEDARRARVAGRV